MVAFIGGCIAGCGFNILTKYGNPAGWLIMSIGIIISLVDLALRVARILKEPA